MGFRIIPGYYLYRDKLSVRSLSDGVMAGQLELPKGKIKVDEFFGESEYIRMNEWINYLQPT